MSAPDFSGDWVLNRQASTLSPGADGIESGVWHIEHREPRFRHKARFESSGKPIEYEYELVSDGRDVVSREGDATTTSSLGWDGDVLVVTMRTAHPAGEVALSFRYQLVDDGQRLRATERLRGTDHDQDNVWIFDRRA